MSGEPVDLSMPGAPNEFSFFQLQMKRYIEPESYAKEAIERINSVSQLPGPLTPPIEPKTTQLSARDRLRRLLNVTRSKPKEKQSSQPTKSEETLLSVDPRKQAYAIMSEAFDLAQLIVNGPQYTPTETDYNLPTLTPTQVNELGQQARRLGKVAMTKLAKHFLQPDHLNPAGIALLLMGDDSVGDFIEKLHNLTSALPPDRESALRPVVQRASEIYQRGGEIRWPELNSQTPFLWNVIALNPYGVIERVSQESNMMRQQLDMSRTPEELVAEMLTPNPPPSKNPPENE